MFTQRQILVVTCTATTVAGNSRMGVSIYLSTEQIHALQQLATYLDYNGGDEKVLRETNNLVNLYSEIEKKIFKAQQRSNNLKAAKKIIKNKGF